MAPSSSSSDNGGGGSSSSSRDSKRVRRTIPDESRHALAGTESVAGEMEDDVKLELAIFAPPSSSSYL